ncbi:hypothetical protein LXA43DRAFT_1092415 [Ganoderma leucocontextum]|nr:hypothetical protein LXA43DRAFT_1092415 [Ganoderma leucocontextum]
MRYSTAILAALMGVLQARAPSTSWAAPEPLPSPRSRPPLSRGAPVLPFPSASGGFPSGPAFPSGSFSLPSGISLPSFPSGSAFPGPSGGCGVPFPSGVSITGFPGPEYTASGSEASLVSVQTDCVPGAYSYSYSYPYPTGGPSIPTPSVARPSATGKGGVPDEPLTGPYALSSLSERGSQAGHGAHLSPARESTRSQPATAL